MKFYYSQKLNKFAITNLGKLIDSDDDEIALGIRHGFISDQSEDEEQEKFLLDADDDDPLSDEGFFRAVPDGSDELFDYYGNAAIMRTNGEDDTATDDDYLEDDLEVIREFMESDA